MLIAIPASAETPGVSGFGPDNAFRDATRATSADGRSRADTISYVTLAIALAQPFAFDVYEGIANRDARGGLASAAIDLGTIAVGFTMNHFVIKPAFGSAGFDNLRPMAAECLASSSYDAYCTTSELRQGNPSDHAALSAMGFGLMVAKVVTDRELPRSPWVVGGSIALGAVAMLSTDYLRVAADKHWLSETMLGDVVGFSFGLGLPLLAHALGFGYGRFQNVQLLAAPAPSGLFVGVRGVL